MLDPERAQLPDHDARVFAGDVAEDEIALGVEHRVGEMGDIDDGRRPLQDAQHVGRPLARHDDPQMIH